MNSQRMTRMCLLLAVLAACIGCDQVSKSLATRTLAPREGFESYLGDTFRLQYALNSGAFLGMGGNSDPQQRFWTLTVANGGLLAFVAAALLTKWNMPRSYFFAWALILAGGIGNLIDRVTHDGLVTDFLNLGIGPLRTGIFNVADMAITAGFGIFVIVWWREDRAARQGQQVASANHLAVLAAPGEPAEKT